MDTPALSVGKIELIVKADHLFCDALALSHARIAIDDSHLLCGKGKVEDGAVFTYVLLILRSWQRDASVLDNPSNCNL